MQNTTRFRVMTRTAASVAALGWFVAGADAAEVSFPKDKPVLSMVVPDDWTVSYTSFGLEIESAEKNVYIVADVQPRRKDVAETWAKKALARIQAFGVSFDHRPKTMIPGVAPAAEATHSPSTASAIPSEPTKPVAAAVSPPAIQPAPKAAELQKDEVKTPAPPAPQPASAPVVKAPLDRSAPFFTFLNGAPDPKKAAAPNAEDPVPVFSGNPSLATPHKPDVKLDVASDAPQGQTLEELTKPDVSDLPSIPFRVGRYPAAVWKDQPIDVQIVNFGLSNDQLFLVIQASLSTDDRAVAVIKSVKRVTATP